MSDRSVILTRIVNKSLDLIGDQAAHPVYNHSHSWPCVPLTQTQTDAVRNESAAGHSPSSVDCNVTLL